MVEFEIDDQTVKIEEGATIIEAADQVGIYIPRFCYHEKLSIAANCRMCLVEVVGAPKSLPACATPVTPGMKVYTASPAALKSQRIVMEFLLANHPLDCPICDQGGMCELQDLAMGFGSHESHFEETKDAVASPDIGPLIDTEMTRCIACTRCVRFGEEIAGIRELGVVQRGEHATISTYLPHVMQSELSGNIIDICPVGALNAKPSRYSARGWEVKEYPSVSPHDCVGTNVFVHSRGKDNYPERYVTSVVPRQCDSINEVWMSDRDRFSYEGLSHPDRLLAPMLKRDGEWIEVSWKRILTEVMDRIQGLIHHRGPGQLAALLSPNMMLEDYYLTQKLMSALGSPHVDHRIREQDFSDQQQMGLSPNLGVSIESIENVEVICLIGSNLRFEQPMIAHRVRKAIQDNQASVFAINPVQYDFAFDVENEIIEKDILHALVSVLKSLEILHGKTSSITESVAVNSVSEAMASRLDEAEHGVLFLGSTAMHHPHAAVIRYVANQIAALAKVSVGLLVDGANGVGAWQAGAVPHRGPAGEVLEKAGLDAKSLLTTDAVRGYLLMGWEPDQDSTYAYEAMQALNNAGLVVAMTSFRSQSLMDCADFLLPITPFSECSGTMVNIEGQWQWAHAASLPHGEAKPAWKVIRALAGFMMLNGFEYIDQQSIAEELKQKIMDNDTMPAAREVVIDRLPEKEDGCHRLASWPCYRVDGLVRRAASLQEVYQDDRPVIAMNSQTAQRLGLVVHRLVSAQQGEQSVTLPMILNDRIADDMVHIPSGFVETAGFGSAFSPVQLKQEK